jgi:hypothetical protein
MPLMLLSLPQLLPQSTTSFCGEPLEIASINHTARDLSPFCPMSLQREKKLEPLEGG